MLGMYDPDSVQPVDGYVSSFLKSAKISLGIAVDTENPTRGQRLEVAVALHDESIKKGGTPSEAAIEVMVGKRLDAFALLSYKALRAENKGDIREYYGSLPHLYWNEDKKKAEEPKKYIVPVTKTTPKKQGIMKEIFDRIKREYGFYKLRNDFKKK